MKTNNGKSRLIALLLWGMIAFTVAPTLSQDFTPRTEDLLRWFPLGDYDLIVHKDIESLKEAYTWEIYQKLFESYNSWIKIDFQLPTPLKTGIQSATMAQVLRVRTAIFDTDLQANEYKQVYGDMMTSEIVNDKILKFESVGQRFYVVRYLYAEEKMERALKRGLVEKMKLKLYDRPVYLYSAVVRGQSQELFFYVSEQQELLIAMDLNSLVRMVHTGRGYFLSLIDGRDYQDLPHISDYLGNAWQFTSFSAHYRALIVRMRKSGSSPTKLDAIRNKLLEGESYKVKSLSLDEELTFRSLHRFETLSRAEDWYRNNQLSYNIDFMTSSFINRNYMLYFQPYENELNGNIVLSKVSYAGKSVDHLFSELETLPDLEKNLKELLREAKDRKTESTTP